MSFLEYYFSKTKKVRLKSVFLMLLLSKVLFGNTPDWYVNRDIKQPIQNETIGYGEDSNLPNAILSAKTDISMQLQSHIKSSISMNTHRSNAEYTHDTSLLQQVDTDQVLMEASVIKQQYQDDKWYVAVSYENIPSVMRFIKKLPAGLKNEKQNSFLTNTILYKELNQLLGININARLFYADEHWNINYQNVIQRIDLSIPDLFITHSTTPFNKLIISKNSKLDSIINSGESILFKTASLKKYVSIFAITPEGKVLVLEDNIPTSSIQAPFNFECLTGEERETMFVAVFSNNNIDNAYFRMMQGNEERSSYKNGSIKFDKFIEFLDGKEFVSKKMVIK